MKTKLIEAIEAVQRDDLTSGCRDEFIDLINQHIPDDMVLVKRADIENLSTWYLQDHIETNLAVEAMIKQGEEG